MKVSFSLSNELRRFLKVMAVLAWYERGTPPLSAQISRVGARYRENSIFRTRQPSREALFSLAWSYLRTVFLNPTYPCKGMTFQSLSLCVSACAQVRVSDTLECVLDTLVGRHRAQLDTLVGVLNRSRRASVL